jgi:hypothetical protein
VQTWPSADSTKTRRDGYPIGVSSVQLQQFAVVEITRAQLRALNDVTRDRVIYISINQDQ